MYTVGLDVDINYCYELIQKFFIYPQKGEETLLICMSNIIIGLPPKLYNKKGECMYADNIDVKEMTVHFEHDKLFEIKTLKEMGFIFIPGNYKIMVLDPNYTLDFEKVNEFASKGLGTSGIYQVIDDKNACEV
jgi:hypothetical protein